MLLWLIISACILLLYSLNISKYDVTAGSFAVIASTISAIFAYEIIHKDKVNQLPFVTIGFDDHSRYSFFQFVVKNIGGSTAFNVQVEWLNELNNSSSSYSIPKNLEGKPIRFHKEDQFNRILALQKGETHYTLVNSHNEFFKQNKPACFLARITFEDSFIDGEKYSYLIPISLEENKWTLDHIDEKLKAEYQIQKLPKKLDDIKSELERMNNNKKSELKLHQLLIDSLQHKNNS
ncbi:hypothetical protein GCM10027291_43060 [Telluribacter humicola]